MGAQGLTTKGIIGDFYARLEQSSFPGLVDRLAMPFDSNQAVESYNWLGQAPVLREWVGGRQAQGLNETSWDVRNVKYEATLGIPTDWIRRDKTGQIAVRINDMADRTAAHPWKLLTALMVAGESTACYDGQYFFDTDHSEGSSGTQSNDISVDISELPVNQNGSTTAPSPEEMEQCILQGIQQIGTFVDDKGEPMNEEAMAFEIVVPQTFQHAALAAVNNLTLTSGRTNTLAASTFDINLVATPRLSDWTEQFAVFRTDASAKPFIHQVEEDVSVMALEDDSEHAFKNDEQLFGVKKIYTLALGLWQYGCLVTMT